MIGVAVVGLGYWGPNIVRNFSELPECAVRAVCDLDAKRLASVQRRYPGVAARTRFEEILADDAVDAVAICTPVRTHHPLARAALEAGKHVLVEKPLTHSVETARALVSLAEARGLVLQVDHTFVYSGAVRKIRSIIDSGEVGDLLYFDSVRVNLGLFQPDVNVVWDLAPHDISIMTHLIDREPRWVSAVGIAPYGEFANLAYVTVKYDGPLVAHLHVNWLAPVKLRSTLIGGSKKMIVYDDLEPSEKIRVYEKGVTVNGSADATSRAQALIDYRVGDMHAPYIDKTEPLRRACATFLGAIASGTPVETDGWAGLRVVQVLEAAQQSLDREGERVELAPLVRTRPVAVSGGRRT
jgi:predicted dehydrogenase